MALFARFRSRKEDPEVERRLRLRSGGRIADGAVFDIGTDENGSATHIFYSYTVGGVEYQSSQYLDQDQLARPDDYSPGSRVTIRYDPHHPGNSLVV